MLIPFFVRNSRILRPFGLFQCAKYELVFDKSKAEYGGMNNNSIYYNQDMGGFHSRIDTKDIGKVINGVCYQSCNYSVFWIWWPENWKTSVRDPKKIKEEKVVSKVIWFRDGEGVLEETVL